MSRKRTQEPAIAGNAPLLRDRVAWDVAALALAANLPEIGAGFVYDDHPIVE
jgi:hypothetical protein